MNKIFTYLAVPYRHSDPKVVEERFNLVNAVAAQMMEDGDFVFSPISHSHPIALAGNLPGDWKYWEKYDRAMLENCRRLVVLCLPGWRESEGVQAEMKIAAELGLPVTYTNPLYDEATL